jgi:hypothetical protein
MKGDFTRLTFEREKHFSQVLRQQGRVTVDADDNEQTAILLHYLRTLARDLIGPYGTPLDGGGFAVTVDGDDLLLSAGRTYVDGLLVENDDDPYRVDRDQLKAIKESDQAAWLYLDVWERHITSLDDDAIRESALGGPDTSTRAQVTWQVKSLPMFDAYEDRIAVLTARDPDGANEQIQLEIKALTDGLSAIKTELAAFRKNHKNPPAATLCARPGLLLQGVSVATMAARVDPGAMAPDPCVLSPEARYRGMENQLYRVEIQRGGVVGDEDGPTFKWSRDNGSVTTRWLSSEKSDLVVAHGRGFSAGAWVELTDETEELAGVPGVLVKLARVDGNRLTVDDGSAPALSPQRVNPRIRRWDQAQRDDVVLDEGAVPIVESEAGVAPEWLDLEDGVQVAFMAGGEYRSGDYWLIPARVATGTIEWPVGMALPPRGVEHHYAPLGFVWWDDEDLIAGGCRCVFSPGSACGTDFHTAGPRAAPVRVLPERAVGSGPAAPPRDPVTRPGRTRRRRGPQ